MFNIIVGNPPYGYTGHCIPPSGHLDIMRNSLDHCTGRLSFIMPSKPITQRLEDKWYDMFINAVCTNIEVCEKSVFPETVMDNTAIYYCNRNEDPKNHCKKLDVDLYSKLPEEGRIIMDRLAMFTPITMYSNLRDRYQISMDRCIKRLKDGIYYLNVNRHYGSFGANWISRKMRNIGILDWEEEKEYLLNNRSAKNIIGCPNKQYGENLKYLMTEGLVLRFGLWVTQSKRQILQPQFRYVPDIDYTNINTDEELLKACGFTEEDITRVMDYLKKFDFKQNRNELVRGYDDSLYVYREFSDGDGRMVA